MKRFFALFFSVLLGISQIAFTPASNANAQRSASSKCCGHCQRCKGQSCCLAKSDSNAARSSPAVPAQRVSHLDYQIFAAVLIQFLPQRTADPVSLLSFSVPPSVAAPLYQRNCCYLI
jgi:hypothetical protein